MRPDDFMSYLAYLVIIVSLIKVSLITSGANPCSTLEFYFEIFGSIFRVLLIFSSFNDF